ncbi:hypothetical protein BH23VER1_BH23VER1_05490 [soil metagenome]
MNEEFHRWKAQIHHDFALWLDDLDSPPPEPPDDSGETPDLYSFFEELAALRNESRTGNRRGTEVVSKLTESLSRCEDQLGILAQHAASPPTNHEPLPRKYCLSLVELLDRMDRIASALERPPTPSRRWFAPRADSLTTAWESLREGFAILRRHTTGLLRDAGISTIPATGEPFDPLKMIAVSAEHEPGVEPNQVLEEIQPGYQIDGEILRLAEVKVSTSSQPPSPSPTIPPPHA